MPLLQAHFYALTFLCQNIYLFPFCQPFNDGVWLSIYLPSNDYVGATGLKLICSTQVYLNDFTNFHGSLVPLFQFSHKYTNIFATLFFNRLIMLIYTFSLCPLYTLLLSIYYLWELVYLPLLFTLF